MAVNRKILDYLKTRNVSQADLAEKLGIAQQNLNRLLHSKDIKVSQLLEITKALDIPVTYFFDGKEHVSNEEILEYKRKIEDLTRSINLEQKHFNSLNLQMKHTSNYIDETIELLFKNRILLEKLKKEDYENIANSLRENIYCRFEYGYSKKKFEKNILFILSNPKKLPLEGDKYDNVFKSK